MVKVITPPITEPVTIDELKAQVVIGHTADDALLSLYLSAVRGHGEFLTGRSWAPQTLEVVLDSFPISGGRIDLPHGPVTSVSSVTYIDTAGVETVLDVYGYDTALDGLVGYICPVYASTWPETQNKPESVRVRYVAGWSILPSPLKQWIMVKVASFYAQRESHIVGFSVGQKVASMPRDFVDAILDAFSIPKGA